MDGPRLVLITAPDLETARRLDRELVERRLAACVQVVPGATSVYRWEGALREEHEVLLIVKTLGERLPALEAFFAERHPYDVPELVALEPAHVEARYRAWLGEEVSGA